MNDTYQRSRAATFSALGQPRGQTLRESAKWRRANTYYIVREETILPEVLATPPACFTAQEWEGYLASVPPDGFRRPDSPFTVAHETRAEVLARQRRSALMAACDDCMLPYQLSQVLVNRCHPPRFAITPADRLLNAERMERDTDDYRPGRAGATAPHVLSQEGVPEREVR